MSELKVTVLIDNIENNGLSGEWGLSLFIEYGGKRFLLDAGSDGAFALNAQILGIDLQTVDYAVLSHAHYDHADGFPAFFGLNSTAKLYLRAGTKENCYSKHEDVEKYIGIGRGMLNEYSSRIIYVDGDHPLFSGVFLIGHKGENNALKGKKAGMFRIDGSEVSYDDFSHEQSLVFKTSKGLVVFNSCSHAGAADIINEVTETFPGEKVYALIGGFHLFRSDEDEIAAFAEKLKNTRTEKIVTGHCTGDKAFEILKDALGEKVQQMFSGYVFEV